MPAPGSVMPKLKRSAGCSELLGVHPDVAEQGAET